MSRPWTIGRLADEVVELLGVKPDRVERGNLTFDQGPLQSSLWIWKDVQAKATYGWSVVTFDVALYDRTKTFGTPAAQIEHPPPTGTAAMTNAPQPACYTWSATGGLSAEAAASVNEHALDSLRFVRDQHDLGQLLLARTHVRRGNLWSFAPDNNEPARLAQALLLARATGDQALERAAIAKLRQRGEEPTTRRPDYRFKDAFADWAKRYSKATGVDVKMT
ncbi:hypothetical protein G3I60_04865 [Streptomyces sp. SID13666]|uniref:hypothetical protein n=1 Tax=unclassified Streptomyces TaxID=2593676 RepID=UPI0013C16615|nr:MULTISPECIES: hypothetical protein [unclassified Streptomyces]NEA53501.1 hypothetical protein [Streptomyces sp. SID13666]NEA69175.1 hypothetical protein [Streptomyces sp. SID13588]